MNKFTSTLIATIAATAAADGHATYMPLEIYSPYYNGDFTFWVKGLDNQCLKTEGSTMDMAQNNRTWIRDRALDDLYWVYHHNFLGGTMEFDVDLSEVDCASASGVYLVEADGDKCSYAPKEGDSTPQCSRVEIMEANKLGFKVSSFPCLFEQCEPNSQSEQWPARDQYGPGEEFTINTAKPFKVTTKFYAPKFQESHEDLKRIVTILSQEGRQIEMTQADSDFLWPISHKLYGSMAVVVSNFDAGIDNVISRQVCPAPSGEYHTKFSNFRWTIDDSNEGEADDGEETSDIVIGEVAESLDDCGDSSCSACHLAWPADNTDEQFFMCTDYTSYKYLNNCEGTRRSLELCGEYDDCFMSFPADDSKKRKSEDFACRPLPSRLYEGPFKYARRQCKENRFGPKGLCFEGCGDSTCHMSWPVDDTARWKSADAMCRCKEEF